MYEQGKSESFQADKFFKNYWYHILTNVRPSSSILKKIQGQPMACDNVIIEYKPEKNGSVAYHNACYVNRVYNSKMSRGGVLSPDPSSSGLYKMTDSESGKTRVFSILVTDYDHYAIVTNGGASFWVLSRKPTICGNTLGRILDKLKELNYDVKNVSVDFETVTDCSSKK